MGGILLDFDCLKLFLFLPSLLNDSLAIYKILDWKLLYLNTLKL